MLMRRLLATGGGGGVFSAGLSPSSTLTITRSGSNPTLNFNALVENQILVGSTYWCVYQPSANDIRLASASSPNGPWTAYSGNPVLTGAGLLYAPHLLEEAGTYYIFYSVTTGDPNPNIYYATASAVTGPYTKQGQVLAKGSAGAWDDLRVGEPSIVKVGSTYYMAFMGDRAPEQSAERLGIATAASLAGPWTKGGSNPILGVGSGFDAYGVADPEIWYEGGRFWIYYTGLAGPTGVSFFRTGLAYATDAVNGPWTRFSGNPVFGPSGTGGAFDEQGVFRGAIFRQAGAYYLLYTGIPSGAVDLATMKGGNATITVT